MGGIGRVARGSPAGPPDLGLAPAALFRRWVVPDKAFLVVDVQNDFCPGGSLEVRAGDEVVPFINAKRREFELVVFTQDWHPANHQSFASQHPGKRPFDVIDLHSQSQVLWPDHCVQGTRGAEFHPGLDVRAEDPVFRKGQLAAVDSYSGFLDNDRRNETGLREFLQQQGVAEVYVVGLATDVCVRFTVLDAVQFGFRAFIYPAGCRAVNLQPDDERNAYRAMEEAGAVVLP